MNEIEYVLVVALCLRVSHVTLWSYVFVLGMYSRAVVPREFLAFCTICLSEIPYARPMEYRRFGRTGLDVSLVGIGTGGASRLGIANGLSEEGAMAVVHRGMELGINYFDTAENYKNEHILGRAIVGHRDEVVLSTKIDPVCADGEFRDEQGLRDAVELSLKKLNTDVIDVFHMHHVTKRSYDHAADVLVPELMKLRDEGKIRFIALSESSGRDPDHAVLARAVQASCWDVIMVSFNLFNQSARAEVFPATIEHDIAIEIMASARSQFSQPALLIAEMERLIAAGQLEADQINPDDPLDFLRAGDREVTLTEASYRFAAHEPGVHVVLIGTGNIAHLEENVEALNRGPLPTEIRQRLISMFGHLQAEIFIPGRDLGHV